MRIDLLHCQRHLCRICRKLSVAARHDDERVPHAVGSCQDPVRGNQSSTAEVPPARVREGDLPLPLAWRGVLPSHDSLAASRVPGSVVGALLATHRPWRRWRHWCWRHGGGSWSRILNPEPLHHRLDGLEDLGARWEYLRSGRLETSTAPCVGRRQFDRVAVSAQVGGQIGRNAGGEVERSARIAGAVEVGLPVDALYGALHSRSNGVDCGLVGMIGVRVRPGSQDHLSIGVDVQVQIHRGLEQHSPERLRLGLRSPRGTHVGLAALVRGRRLAAVPVLGPVAVQIDTSAGRPRVHGPVLPPHRIRSL
mmetsp:Transcript_125044/g.335630  ORF Transcript_125044/g.335630 Transcript_125044/m.335630 type:complete len:308 (-) Transcript_125044:299-1222(-)